MSESTTDDLPEPWPVPARDSAELREQARAAVAWIQAMMDVAGFEDAVFERRVGVPYEMGKLVQRLDTEARVRRLESPGIVWTCTERLITHGPENERSRWVSALAREFYWTRREEAAAAR